MNFLDSFLNLFTYGFMIRALIAGLLIGLSGAFLGSFLVLKRYAMIGQGLAHVAFGAVAVGLLFSSQPLFIAMPLVVLVSVFILKLSEKTSVHGDAAIGLAATVAMALGTMLASIDGGFQTELNSYLFGSILTIQTTDIWLSFLLFIAVALFGVFYYYDLFSMTYDPIFAEVSRVKVQRLNLVLAVLTGVTVVIGIQLLGTILISSFIIFPTVIAMQFQKGFFATVMVALGFAVSTVFVGISASFIYDLPTGSTIVLLNALIFSLIYAFNALKGGRA